MRDLTLYNTRTRQLEPFTPQDPKHVKIYTCGPTVYSMPHIGNFTAYIYWDTLLRALRLNRMTPYRVMNITDVGHLTSDEDAGEDKMEKGAAREGKTVWEVAAYYTAEFLKHFRALGLLEPDKIAKATDYIPQDLALVDTLTTKGYTYELTDGIYYDTAKFPAYADFARLQLDQLKAGARVEHIAGKRNVADFAVWKFILPGEKHTMRWDYRDRPGYPGWHLECSTIIHSELGETIDIHTGGIDHIPVHHTNEIAQSEAAYDTRLSNFWLHNNHITIDGQKISKSLGNTITFDELTAADYTHLDYRMWTLEGHYQSGRNFTIDNLAAAKQRLLGYRNWAALRHQSQAVAAALLKQTVVKITTAINDNLNTAPALAALDQITAQTAPDTKFLQLLDDIFGLQLLDSTPDITAAQKQLITDRKAAREAKDWQQSDALRNQLLAQGLTVLDTPAGPIWQYA
jgi:cysteinyl-tRNA synthetase